MVPSPHPLQAADTVVRGQDGDSEQGLSPGVSSLEKLAGRVTFAGAKRLRLAGAIMGRMSSSFRESEAHQFLLFNITSKYSEVLEEVPKNKLQPGDILLFPLDSKYGRASGSLKHAAVYCGDGEVIHFQDRGRGKSGLILKEGFRVMKMERKEYQVYRKKGGINLNDFRVKVRKAMNSQAKYSLRKNNCIHFALFLVGLADFDMKEPSSASDVHPEGRDTRLPPAPADPSSPLHFPQPVVEIPQPGSRTGSGPAETRKSSMSSTMSSSFRESEAHQFLLFNITSKYSEVLEEVPKNKLQPGDILLFPLDSKYGRASGSLKHAAVYCGDGEVIHFQDRGRGKSGLILKEGFRVMKMERKEYQVYRKKGGINLNDFRVKVRKAMNSQAKYSLRKNNCIHFALFLVGLADFDMKEVETPDEDYSYSDGAVSIPGVSPPQHGCGVLGRTWCPNEGWVPKRTLGCPRGLSLKEEWGLWVGCRVPRRPVGLPRELGCLRSWSPQTRLESPNRAE
ncbi:PREDICTED: uncharacterized protein LOC106898506, partial [Calidris pugnax]|uniref:uncharacterized protein LOC106898506 n=1 Tax=Calidris pugnax TaxID=198806 RepID=UPI00071CD36C